MDNYLHLKDRQNLPDCESNCPIEDSMDDSIAAWTCENCFLNSDEYERLTTHSPLFYLSIEHLNFHELGLAPSKEDYTHREKVAISLVSGELNRITREKHQEKVETAKEKRDKMKANKPPFRR